MRLTFAHLTILLIFQAQCKERKHTENEKKKRNTTNSNNNTKQNNNNKHMHQYAANDAVWKAVYDTVKVIPNDGTLNINKVFIIYYKTEREREHEVKSVHMHVRISISQKF